MPETIILNTLKTHFDNDGDLLPEFASGTDTFSFTVPPRMRYDRYEIRKVEGTSLFAGVNVTAHPSANATGQQTLKVKWQYEPLGKIRYAIKVFAEAVDTSPQPLRINLLSSDCVERATEAINQK